VENATGIKWVEFMDATKHPTVCRQFPTTKSYFKMSIAPSLRDHVLNNERRCCFGYQILKDKLLTFGGAFLITG